MKTKTDLIQVAQSIIGQPDREAAAAIHNPSQDTLPVRSAHTPLPLKFSNDATLRDADGMMVGQVVRRDQAKLIVHAVNHHAALIALTEDMADSYDRCQRIYARMVNETVSQVTVEEAERMLAHAVGRARSLVARAALQAAQEGKPGMRKERP